ncbi:MAG: acyl--CoA ligase [Gammaproteobacteria bacterium]|nr:acyl--CoA ligase [Gammaproteobacteria bacterium]
MSNPDSTSTTLPPRFEFSGPLLPDFVRLHARWYPDKPAVADEEVTLTWGELDRRSNAVANGLRSLGVRNGDSVAILLENCVEYVEILYGAWKAGAVVVPLNLAVNESGLMMMLQDAAVRVLVCSLVQQQRLAGRLGEAASLLPDGVIVHDGASGAYVRWRDSQDTGQPAVTIGDDEPCNIIYSSGTTALPKGIKHVHRRRVQSIYELAMAHRYHYGAVSICPIGLYSNTAWGSLMCSLIVGGTCLIRRRFDPEAWIEDVERHQVTHAMMVPIMFQRILDAPNFRPAAVKSVQAVLSGGSPLFEGLKRRVMENFSCAVIELYGLTEGFMTTLQPEETEGRLASVGKPVRGNDYILLDDDDQPVAWGGTGEICVRSVHWMIEYHNRPDATREAMFIDSRGVQWLRTGDIGRTDEDGFLYIVDRKKDMILSGGQNIYPADIEAVMVGHPLVAEVGVIGVPDATWGETPVAIVVLRPGSAAGNVAPAILEWTNQQVGRRQRLREVRIVETLPRNPNGKILKRELRQTYVAAGEAESRATGPRENR